MEILVPSIYNDLSMSMQYHVDEQVSPAAKDVLERVAVVSNTRELFPKPTFEVLHFKTLADLYHHVKTQPFSKNFIYTVGLAAGLLI